MMKHLFVWSFRFIGIFLFSLMFNPELYAIEGRCVPTPPCYCNPECFRCGPGGCSKPSSPSYQPQPSYDYEAERQREEAERQHKLEAEKQRQRELEEQRKREEEAAKKKQEAFERDKQEALKSMKGFDEEKLGIKDVDSGGMGLKNIGDTGQGNLGLKEIDDHKAIKDKQANEKRRKAWQKALNCAIEEVYAHAESLGPEWKNLANDLRKEMKNILNEAGKKVKIKDGVSIVSLRRDKQVSTGSKDGQFIVHAAVYSNSDGDINVDVQSSLSKSSDKKHKQKNLESSNILYINKFGEVTTTDNTSAVVKACLKR